MATIGWDEASPADTEVISLGDDRIKSLKTSVRIGLAAEHTWPSAGGDAGIHLLGSARAFFATQSLVSSSGTDGRLMVTSTTSNLFHVGSEGTMFLGGQRTISAGSSPVGGQKFYWAQEFGAVVASLGVTTIIFPNSGFSGIPFVVASAVTSSNVPIIVTLGNIITTAFDAQGYSVGAVAQSGHTIMWHSIGTRTH